VTIEFADYVKIVGSSAVIGSLTGALVSGLFAWRKDHREQNRERFVSTLIAAETLENFTRACLQMIYIDDEAQDEAVRLHSYDPLNRVKLPAFSYPDTVTWKWMKPATAGKLREFTSAWNASARSIRNNADYDDQFSTCDEVTAACSRLGLKAWALAKHVRTKTSLPKAVLHDNETHLLERLQEEINKRAARKAEWEAKQKAACETPPVVKSDE
jgi:hypothetical protein